MRVPMTAAIVLGRPAPGDCYTRRRTSRQRWAVGVDLPEGRIPHEYEPGHVSHRAARADASRDSSRRRLSASEPPQAARSGSRRRHRALRPRQQGLVHTSGRGATKCRNDGVKMRRCRRARRPAVAAVAKAPGRHFSSEDMDIIPVGDRAIVGVGLQACARHGRNAFAFFDVTKPRHPPVPHRCARARGS